MVTHGWPAEVIGLHGARATEDRVASLTRAARFALLAVVRRRLRCVHAHRSHGHTEESRELRYVWRMFNAPRARIPVSRAWRNDTGIYWCGAPKKKE